MNKAELIDRTITLFKRLGHMHMRHAFEPWRKLDVPLAQLKSLFLIHIGGSLPSRNLAVHLGVTPGDVTSIVDRLVAQELVKRGKDLEDRRVVLLQLTDKGRKIITDIHVTGTGRMKEILERMSPDDVDALYRGVSALLVIAEADYKTNASDRNTPEPCASRSKPPGDAGGKTAGPVP